MMPSLLPISPEPRIAIRMLPPYWLSRNNAWRRARITLKNDIARMDESKPGATLGRTMAVKAKTLKQPVTILRRYTSLASLLALLQDKNLTLLSPALWED